MIFETLDTSGHEQVVFCHNKDAGLKAIIAIHNTVLGPALGGTRMWPYKTEAGRAQRRAAPVARHDLQERGRGPEHRRRQGRDHRRPGHGQVRGAVPRVRPLRRTRWAAATSPPRTSASTSTTWNTCYRETEYVTGVHQVHGGSGDPSPFTAYGTLQGLMATLNKQVRRRGSRQVLLRRAGPGPRRHGVREAAARSAARRSSSPTSTRTLVDKAVSTSTAPKPSAWTRSTTCRRRLLAVRARRHGQREHPAPPEVQGHLRRRQQPAGQQRHRRRSRRSAASCTRRTTR